MRRLGIAAAILVAALLALSRPASKAALDVVVLADGAPAEGAVVTLTSEATGTFFAFPLPAGGVQAVEGLPSGPCRVEASRPGFRPASARVRAVEGRVLLVLRRPARVEGAVSDCSGRPLANAAVHALRPGSGEPLAAAATDVDGLYALEGFGEGAFELRVRRDGLRSARFGVPRVSEGETLRVDAVLERGASIAGRVLGAEGVPLEGATVVAGNEETTSVAADAAGRFRLEGLGPGPVACFATAPGRGAAHRFDVEPGAEDLEFRLPREASLSGRLSGDAPPDRFALHVLRFERGSFIPFAVQPGEGGAFELRGLSPGRYRLRADAEGFEAAEVDVTLAPGEAREGLRVQIRNRP